LNVIASYSSGATATMWYIDAYRDGEPTRRIGGDPEALFDVERDA
jgi:hypothetical protein